MTSYTLSNWDGNQRELPKNQTNTAPSTTTTSNSTSVVNVVPVGPVQQPLGNGVVDGNQRQVGLASLNDYDSNSEMDMETEDGSFDSLFDEDVHKTRRSPVSKEWSPEIGLLGKENSETASKFKTYDVESGMPRDGEPTRMNKATTATPAKPAASLFIPKEIARVKPAAKTYVPGGTLNQSRIRDQVNSNIHQKLKGEYLTGRFNQRTNGMTPSMTNSPPVETVPQAEKNALPARTPGNAHVKSTLKRLLPKPSSPAILNRLDIANAARSAMQREAVKFNATSPKKRRDSSTTASIPSIVQEGEVAAVQNEAIQVDATSLRNLFDDATHVTLASPISKRNLAGAQRPSRHSIEAETASILSRSEGLSVYSIDAEGEEEDEDIEVIDLTKSPPQPAPNVQLARHSSSPPPGHGDGLFHSSARPHSPKTRRKLMSVFVQVPPLPKGKHKRNYKPFPKNIPSKPPLPPKIPRNSLSKLKPGIEGHNSLASALSSVFQVNAAYTSLGSPTSLSRPNPSPPQRVKKRKKLESSDIRPKKKSRPVPALPPRPPSLAEKPLATPLLPQRRPIQSEQTHLPPLPPRPRPRSPSVFRSPSPPPRYLYDPQRDYLQLRLRQPRQDLNDAHIWRNVRFLLADSREGGDEADSLTPSQVNQGTDGGPLVNTSQTAQDDEESVYSLGGSLSDDVDDTSDAVDAYEEPDFESEESFGDPPSRPFQDIGRTPSPLLHLDQNASAKRQRRQGEHRSRILAERLQKALPTSESDTTSLHALPLDFSHSSPAVVTLPSQKALGKRRADPPTAEVGRSPYRAPVDHYIGDAFLRSTIPPPIHPHAGPSSHIPDHAQSVYRNPTSEALLASLNSASYFQDARFQHDQLQDDLSEDLSPFLTTHAPSLEPNTDDVSTSVYSMTTLEPWADRQDHYFFDTINPTLLQQPDDFVVDANYDAMGIEYGAEDKQAWDTQEAPIYLREPSQDGPDGQQGRGQIVPSSPSTSSSSSETSALSGSSIPLAQKLNLAFARNSHVGGPSQPRKTKPRSSLATFDFGDIPKPKSDSDDEDWQGGDPNPKLRRGQRKRKKSRRIEEFVSEDDDEVVEEEAVTKTGPPKRTYIIGPPRNQKWQEGGSEAYCHQCRTKSMKLKMNCAVCDRKYCNRCVAVRYPEIEFQSSFAVTHPCPKCTDSCNCDICCRKRGDTFVPAARWHAKFAGADLAGPPPRPMRIKDKAPPTRTLKRSEPSTQSIPTGYLGPVYGLDGSKITRPVFDEPMDQGLESNDLAQPQERRPSQDHGVRPKMRKLFVGAVHHSWRLGPHTIVDLDPVEDPVPVASAKKRTAKRRRMYIGRAVVLCAAPAVLSQAPGVLQAAVDYDSESDSDEEDGKDEGLGESGARNKDMEYFGHDSASPLTPLSESGSESGKQAAWGNGGSGEGEGGGGETFSSDNLEDNDIARAIELSFHACGLSSEPSPTST